ncbi:MAG: DUF983 domain-containing protein [Pseudonocardiaceae bacterium]
MTREVRAADGRTWTVRREINWAKPANAREFEHDVAASGVSGIAMLVIVILMVLAVVFYTPDGVSMPGWLVWVFLGVLMIFPMQWALARPWTVVAITHEPLETSGEHWEGTVRGVLGSRHEATRVARHLERHAVPDDGHGPLEPVY